MAVYKFWKNRHIPKYLQKNSIIHKHKYDLNIDKKVAH